MRLTGTYLLGAPRDAVFAAIHDPVELLAMLPGCREIQQVSPTEYRGLLALHLPGIVGAYDTTVRLVEATPPSYSRFEGELRGRAGSLAGSASFRLTDADQGTRLDYEGEGRIAGPLARLDARFVEGLARSLIKEGLGRLDARLRRSSPPMEIAR
jgi:carbon monoxide dehydrogenase subunit G